jgi:hypothetical protein
MRARLLGFACALLMMSVAGVCGAADPCNIDLEAFLRCNNPRAINYLASLSDAEVGTALGGIVLTDGTEHLKGAKFLGQIKDLPPGTHVYVMEKDGRQRAYAWVEATGTPLPLPSCPESVSLESAYVLSGDVYTWKELQPGHGVVEVMCLAPQWQRDGGLGAGKKP